MLFLELALIRWTGANVLYLSYFSNFVLLGSFLGIGIGFLRAGARRNLFRWAPLALALLVAFVRLFPVGVQSSGSQLLLFGGRLTSSGPPRELVLTVIFLLVAAVMAFVGEGVARTFVRFEPLAAYRLDLIGSVLGIVAFVALSFLRAPPLAWGGIVAAVFLVLLGPLTAVPMAGLQGTALTAMLVMLGFESFASGTFWSPYYKIETQPIPGSGGLLIEVNGVPHQAQLPSAHDPLYATVYSRARPRALDDVLVIGAGGGNDVAVALAHGAKRVDAVEIDPVLFELGRYHPDRPYSDPRVHVHIDDGRAFLEQTGRRYDLVLFALPDSLTLVQGQSSVRLESYLFTRQAIGSARDHLAPGGVFSMYNFYRERWLVDRYANTLRQAFARDPCVVSLGPKSEGRRAVLLDARSSRALDCPVSERWRRAQAPTPATDDHPFPYLRGRTLPTVYLLTIALVLLASVVAVRGVAGPVRPMLRFTDLVCMGAAFLLLETKSVVQFALLFGTTWVVNALVFLGILLSVLAAVAVQQRARFRHPQRLYAVLLGSLALAWLVPPDVLLRLDVVPRFLAAVTLAFLPVFSANLVFTQRFRATSHSATAFGANLVGAVVGGLTEYVALIVGYRSLLIVAAALYGLAFLTGRHHLRPAPAALPTLRVAVPAISSGPVTSSGPAA